MRYVASWPKRNGERAKATFSVGFIWRKRRFQARCRLLARGIARAAPRKIKLGIAERWHYFANNLDPGKPTST